MKCCEKKLTTFTLYFLYGLNHWVTVLIFRCLIANHAKLSSVKQQFFFIVLTDLMSWEFGQDMVELICLCSMMSGT